MKNRPLTEQLLYGLIIFLSLAALALVALSPASFINNALVYKGF